ncbi:type 1 fimbrial protein [Pseudomonas sp. HN8-3]|uniref:type 1 fimbrial protein n=1 Tax=Pseudomonas sp. HN8-3 TaxID=2886361 RepID=UPI001E45FAD9|nr:type 1 fimbrial protein [Pseudomonas sp. HN8-3]UEH06252.1 type 1 fimbrial protein [Pseudomonas sp. HN8-3]
MNVRRFAVVTGLLCLWASTCGAAQTVGQGTIRFTGAIVEPGCATNARSGSVMELRGCARLSRGSRFEVRHVAPVASVNAAHVRLVADSGEGRYYDQRYLLVDAAGKPIESGNYIITMTSP